MLKTHIAYVFYFILPDAVSRMGPRTRPQHVLVVPKTIDIAPTILDIDIDGIAMHLTRTMEIGSVYVPVFIGCGCARHEVALCQKLRVLGYRLRYEMFMDNFVTSAAITNIENYTEMMHSDDDPRPVLIFSFYDLQLHMMQILSRDPFTKFIVIGIHAAQIIKVKEELHTFHTFLCTCARLSGQGTVQPDYLNYMHESSMANISHKEQCGPDSNTWVYRMNWWEHACEIITCKAAAQLLMAEA